MKAEIGSNFWEYNITDEECTHGFWWEDQKFRREYFKSGRNATKALIQKLNVTNKSVLLPIYTCSTVIEPFIDEGWSVSYYYLNTDLSINEDSLVRNCEQAKPSVLLVHSYFGLDTLAISVGLIEKLHNAGIIVIEDITQSLFSKHYIEFADYYVSSLRKYIAIPDGGILFSKKELPLFEKEVSDSQIEKTAIRAFDSKSEYFNDMVPEKKEAFRNEYQKLQNLIEENTVISDISSLSLKIFNGMDKTFIQGRRRENYLYVEKSIKEISGIRSVISVGLGNDTPLFFPFYIDDKRKELQAYLAEKNVYCPVIWPKSKYISDENSDTEYMYSSMLCIPIDQRYGQEEMAYVIGLLKNYYCF